MPFMLSPRKIGNTAGLATAVPSSRIAVSRDHQTPSTLRAAGTNGFHQSLPAGFAISPRLSA